MGAQKILIGALSGFAAGMVIGLLTAPASGRETRQKLAESANDLGGRILDIAGRTIQELDELKTLVENEMDGLKDDVKERVLRLIESGRRRYNNNFNDKEEPTFDTENL
jgi:gas vesicle protein